MPNLICKICGIEKEMPDCCTKSMVISDGMLCCCTDECHHSRIPECCGQEMEYVGGY